VVLTGRAAGEMVNPGLTMVSASTPPALMIGAGVPVGLPAALAAPHTVAGELYGLRPADPLTFTGAFLLLAAVGICC
jgi:hypothetical protein